MSLSDTAIKAAKPRNKPYKLTDEKGMYVLIHPNGGKYFRYDYSFQGKRKTLALGVYPDISLKDARIKREAARKALLNGDDPRVVNQQAELNTFETIAMAFGNKNIKDWLNPRNMARRRLELYVYPLIGHKPISTITTRQVVQCLDAMDAKGITASAIKTSITIRQIFRYAIREGHISDDITSSLKGGLKAPDAVHRSAILEPKELGLLLRKIDSYGGTFPVKSALQLMPLVFVRNSELRLAKWIDIDFDAKQWSFTVTKTKQDHIVPLSTQALEILTKLRSYTGGCEYVFGAKPLGAVSMVKALRFMGYTEGEMTVHGFRAIARTLLDEKLKVRPDFIEHQLAHKVKDFNGRAYNRTSFLEERREMMQQWADYLFELRVAANSANFAN
jgi:integrase